MSEKKYAIMTDGCKFYDKYEDAEKAAKLTVSEPEYVYDMDYNGRGFVSYPAKKTRAKDVYIMETVAVAKQPIPDVEVVKITS